MHEQSTPNPAAQGGNLNTIDLLVGDLPTPVTVWHAARSGERQSTIEAALPSCAQVGQPDRRDRVVSNGAPAGRRRSACCSCAASPVRPGIDATVARHGTSSGPAVGERR
jgi:hypothetical protein